MKENVAFVGLLATGLLAVAGMSGPSTVDAAAPASMPRLVAFAESVPICVMCDVCQTQTHFAEEESWAERTGDPHEECQSPRNCLEHEMNCSHTVDVPAILERARAVALTADIASIQRLIQEHPEIVSYNSARSAVQVKPSTWVRRATRPHMSSGAPS